MMTHHHGHAHLLNPSVPTPNTHPRQTFRARPLPIHQLDQNTAVLTLYAYILESSKEDAYDHVEFLLRPINNRLNIKRVLLKVLLRFIEEDNSTCVGKTLNVMCQPNLRHVISQQGDDVLLNQILNSILEAAVRNRNTSILKCFVKYCTGFDRRWKMSMNAGGEVFEADLWYWALVCDVDQKVLRAVIFLADAVPIEGTRVSGCV